MNPLWWSLIALAGFIVFARWNPLWCYLRDAGRALRQRGKFVFLLVLFSAVAAEWITFALERSRQGEAGLPFQWWADFSAPRGDALPWLALGDAVWASARPFFGVLEPLSCSILVLLAIAFYFRETLVVLWSKASADAALWRGLAVVCSFVVLALLHVAGVGGGLFGQGVLSAGPPVPAGARLGHWLVMGFGYLASVLVQMGLIILFTFTELPERKGKAAPKKKAAAKKRAAKKKSTGAARKPRLLRPDLKPTKAVLPKILTWTFERLMPALPLIALVALVMLPPFLVDLSPSGLLVHRAASVILVFLPLCAVQMILLTEVRDPREILRLNFEFWRVAWLPIVWFMLITLSLLTALSFLGTWLTLGYPEASLPRLLLETTFTALTGLILVWLLAAWTGLFNDHLRFQAPRKTGKSAKAKKKASRRPKKKA